MKRAWMLLLTMYAMAAPAGEVKTSPPAAAEVVHVATALDHLTVLEFNEPVTLAAAGSPVFQIERHEDKLFIKPLKPGASTDLFVWTASRRFTYELEPPGEVKDMNFAIDSRTPAAKPAADTNPRMEEIADMMLTRALLGAECVDSSRIKDEKDRVTVRIEHVFQSRNTIYIHFSVRNQTQHPYRVGAPAIAAAVAPQSALSMTALQNTQLDGQALRKLGQLRERSLTPARAETRQEDLQPGEGTHGVVAIREQLAVPTIYRLIFGAQGPHRVQATLVL